MSFFNLLTQDRQPKQYLLKRPNPPANQFDVLPKSIPNQTFRTAMRTILVPTDFSECSVDAMKYAIHFAGKTERKLLFFHSTFSLIPTSSSNAVYLNAVKSDRESKLKILTDLVEETYRSLKITRDAGKTKFLVKFGTSVVENILETLDEQFIDLIITGTHGATGFGKFFIGSNTASIIGQSYCPVLAIPGNHEFNGIKSIAYASSDLNNLKEELKQIIRITKKLKASLAIFHIAPEADFSSCREKFGSGVFMESMAGHFKFKDMRLHILDGGKTTLVDAIGDFVRDEKPDILAMLTRKRGVLEKVFDPSQTKEISYQLRVPLMAVK